jgi:hypothetical protein
VDELLLDDGEDPNLPTVSWGLICPPFGHFWSFLAIFYGHFWSSLVFSQVHLTAALPTEK